MSLPRKPIKAATSGYTEPIDIWRRYATELEEKALVDPYWDIFRFTDSLPDPTELVRIVGLFLAHRILQDTEYQNRLTVFDSVSKFLGMVQEGYRQSYGYHTKIHSADTAITLYQMIGVYERPRGIDALDELAAILAAFAHDFDSDKLDHLSMEVATFDGDLGLVRDHIQLKCFGPPTHSCLDCIVILPEAKVVFAGDILFVGIAPIMTRESAQKSLDALAWLEERIDSSWKLVPGHGPVTSLDGLQAAKHYYRSLQEAVDQEGCSCLDNHTMCGLDFYTSPPEELRDWTELQRSMVNAFVECEMKEGRDLTDADFTRLTIDAEVLKELRSQSQ
ncbi:hypothetical protein Pmar_PMAR019664 [Perkinsus marinus ATCC 50983]|uniref:Metallo-beta-lactamase domain-containing protein n=1 Tax=Perkinsus marinus (strain ATCC 50983 / TXsc) TaxID=423536 RepID=C5LF46_PERM5|nr:hypothetical protein Pmar_PMAR019664 [Perkinsus marinus ATCC 50983]EER04630.1 hypothetical protein Pmar_PMAR019664 [Perkinsus marinus ATCC 50983]|eukprot:XP_002772814.1 hypothetical protein Pmar_PMAR019664 [Perkinsus marinus ATCC 50983]